MDNTKHVDGFDLVARIEYDDDATPPWDREDGHGPVSDWTTRDKHAGERVLVQDRGSKRYYDFAAAVKFAKQDGWDAPPYGGKAGERAARAVDADFDRLKAWCEDRWHYVGVVVSVAKNGVMLDNWAASLWGIEDDSGDYLDEVSEELFEEAVNRGRQLVALVCKEA